jgi:mannose-6-phosphate isomerase
MYPLKFVPVFQERIWGGTRLRAVLGKSANGSTVGESWELADLPGGTVKADSAGASADGSLSSVIANGPWAGRTLRSLLADSVTRDQIMGDAKLHCGHFPLLVKFLDAQQDLSVQVHPDEGFCADNPGSHLKSEAWYVIHADPGAKIYKGLKPGVTRDQFRTALEQGGAGVESLLNAIKVRSGDCHYLKSGTVHALGAGILAAEVQTPSDTTFRVFDWNRLGPDGKSRTLHVDQAMACIDFEATDDAAEEKSEIVDGDATIRHLVNCDYFSLEHVSLGRDGKKAVVLKEPVIWIVLDGQGVINVQGHSPTAFARGDTLLLPAGMKDAAVRTVTECAWLEARLPGGMNVGT